MEDHSTQTSISIPPATLDTAAKHVLDGDSISEHSTGSDSSSEGDQEPNNQPSASKKRKLGDHNTSKPPTPLLTGFYAVAGENDNGYEDEELKYDHEHYMFFPSDPFASVCYKVEDWTGYIEFPRKTMKPNRRLDFKWEGHDLTGDEYDGYGYIKFTHVGSKVEITGRFHETGDEVVFRGVRMGDAPPVSD